MKQRHCILVAIMVYFLTAILSSNLCVRLQISSSHFNCIFLWSGSGVCLPFGLVLRFYPPLLPPLPQSSNMIVGGGGGAVN